MFSSLLSFFLHDVSGFSFLLSCVILSHSTAEFCRTSGMKAYNIAFVTRLLNHRVNNQTIKFTYELRHDLGQRRVDLAFD